MGSLLCEKRLYNVESVKTAALDVQVIGVDFPTVPFISGEVERLEYVSPKQWEKRRLEAMAKKARLEMAKPRPKTSPYRYVLAEPREKASFPRPFVLGLTPFVLLPSLFLLQDETGEETEQGEDPHNLNGAAW